VTKVKEGDLQTKAKVVSNDEIGILGDATNEMIQGLRERELLKDTFGKYITPEIRDEILSGRIPLDGELKNVTVLFSDLRDFTPFVESTQPKEVVKIINGYFEESEYIPGRSWRPISEALRGSLTPWSVTPLIWPPGLRA